MLQLSSAVAEHLGPRVVALGLVPARRPFDSGAAAEVLPGACVAATRGQVQKNDIGSANLSQLDEEKRKSAKRTTTAA